MEQFFLKALMDKWEFEYLTPEIDPAAYIITAKDINRPALQLTGFFRHFDNGSILIFGNVECDYLMQFDDEEQVRRFEALFEAEGPGVPAMIFCRGHRPPKGLRELALRHGVPLLVTTLPTGAFIGELVIWLKEIFAPTTRMHGVLVNVFGTGVLITGDSGIGKSEAALELVKRGHRLISDDAVDIRKVSDDRLVGTAPEMIKNLLELRGVGIIDVQRLYGIIAVGDSCDIDMVIHLEEWDSKKEYKRFGSKNDYMDILGNSVERYDLPIRPGRNLAIIVETVAMKHHQKEMGYNAADELLKRTNRMIGKDTNKKETD